MRFFILSDLHLSADESPDATACQVKKLCAKIRTDIDLNERILFILLGDIADRGNPQSFSVGRSILSLIKTELNEYTVQFMFTPGNHDLCDNSFCEFDKFTSEFGFSHNYENSPAYAYTFDDTNFIFVDSNVHSDHSAPGNINIAAIRATVRSDMTNVLFCHHALSQGQGDPHDTIQDSAALHVKLVDIGIKFLFHGHTHRADISDFSNSMLEVGCGSLSGNTSWMSLVWHQFTVGYIQNGQIVRIERWIDTGDGHNNFAEDELYPGTKHFADPDNIGKIDYPAVPNHISRHIFAYQDVGEGNYAYMLARDKAISLSAAVHKDKRILLLCDAGMGKSLELNHLAYELSGKYHTFLYPLERYHGENIQALLPTSYQNLPPDRIVLLLDGFDELDSSYVHGFRSKLKEYLEASSSAHIVISSRSNFCRAETSNTSNTFPGFYTYILGPLEAEDIKEYLEAKRIDLRQFENALSEKVSSDFISNPFYLIRIAALFIKNKSLPPKSQLMDELVAESFEVDDTKFSGELGERYNELFTALEKIAFSMQLMQRRRFDDKTEYQNLFSLSERNLAKKSGLLTQEKDGWRFQHNNFQEYLTARYISHLPKETAIDLIFNGSDVYPHWANTLAYLTGFNLKWDLIGWLTKNAPNVLVKAEPDRVNAATRFEIFKKIFDRYESQQLIIRDVLFDSRELAHFAGNRNTLLFLINRIASPRNWTSQYNALTTLLHLPSLYGENIAVREVLLRCCKDYPKTDGNICCLAIFSLALHKLNTSETTALLMKQFGSCSNDYIRWGMYEYLHEAKELDTYIEYCLSGIPLIAHNLNSSSEDSRIGNESFTLVNSLAKVSKSESVKRILQWHLQNQNLDFYGSDRIINSAITNAIEFYRAGDLDFFDILLELYTVFHEKYNHTIINESVRFFRETGTLTAAAVVLTDKNEDAPYLIDALVRSNPSVIESLKDAYMNGQLKSHSSFQRITDRYVRDKDVYEQYAALVKKIDGIDLAPYRAPIDYGAQQKQTVQEYFDSLFSAERMNSLACRMIDILGDPNIITSHLFDDNVYIERTSALQYLQSAMYRYATDCKVTDFFNIVDFDQFCIFESARILSSEHSVVPTKEQKEILTKIIGRALENHALTFNIVYKQNGLSYSSLAQKTLFLIRYLHYPLDESSLLKLTEVPDWIFDNDNRSVKYDYLRGMLQDDKLVQRLIQNVTEQRVQKDVLRDHFDCLASFKDSSLAGFALSVLKNDSDYFLRIAALSYLYVTLGAEYVADQVLPFANGELLLEISIHCKDISQNALRDAMEREYKKSPTLNLQTHLITYGSEMAVDDYVKQVMRDMFPPEKDKTLSDGPTAAISTLHDCKFLPQLESLLIVKMDSSFSDCTWHSLSNALITAFANCGINSKGVAIEIIEKHRPSANEDEKNYRYCNYVIEEIKRIARLQEDRAYSLADTKKILSTIALTD